jgi:uncharacterized membrane protein YgcG
MNKWISSVPVFISLILSSLITFNGCSSAPEVTSSRNNNEIVVDGSQKDWNGVFTPVKDQNVAVSFKNDNDNLYVCFITSDNQKIVRILSMGLTVWLTPSESQNKIGIQYPVKKTFEELRMIRGANNESQGDINQRIQNLLSSQTELIIVNNNNIAVYSGNPDDEKGFHAKIGYSMNQLVYELKIPLANNKEFSQFNFKANPTDNINVKFEGGKFQASGNDGDQERKSGGGGGGGRRGGGGMGGGNRGGGMGRGGGGNPGGEGQNNAPIDYEFKVKLSN